MTASYKFVTAATSDALFSGYCRQIRHSCQHNNLNNTLSTSDVVTCVLRPSVLGQDLSENKQIGLGLGLAGLMLCCETRSCHARHHNDLEGHNNVSRTIYSVYIICLEHHHCGDQQWRSLT